MYVGLALLSTQEVKKKKLENSKRKGVLFLFLSLSMITNGKIIIKESFSN